MRTPRTVNERPKVGVGVIVVKDRLVLIGKRREAYGRGRWAFPGGGLKFGEGFADCAVREVREEAGIRITKVSFATLINDVMKKSGKHYVTIYVTADYRSGEPRAVDGEYEHWEWREWDDFPSPLFIPLQNLLRSGYRPSLV